MGVDGSNLLFACLLCPVRGFSQPLALSLHLIVSRLIDDVYTRVVTTISILRMTSPCEGNQKIACKLHGPGVGDS